MIFPDLLPFSTSDSQQSLPPQPSLLAPPPTLLTSDSGEPSSGAQTLPIRPPSTGSIDIALRFMFRLTAKRFEKRMTTEEGQKKIFQFINAQGGIDALRKKVADIGDGSALSSASVEPPKFPPNCAPSATGPPPASPPSTGGSQSAPMSHPTPPPPSLQTSGSGGLSSGAQTLPNLQPSASSVDLVLQFLFGLTAKKFERVLGTEKEQTKIGEFINANGATRKEFADTSGSQSAPMSHPPPPTSPPPPPATLLTPGIGEPSGGAPTLPIRSPSPVSGGRSFLDDIREFSMNNLKSASRARACVHPPPPGASGGVDLLTVLKTALADINRALGFESDEDPDEEETSTW